MPRSTIIPHHPDRAVFCRTVTKVREPITHYTDLSIYKPQYAPWESWRPPLTPLQLRRTLLRLTPKRALPTLVAELYDTSDGDPRSRAIHIPESRFWRGNNGTTTLGNPYVSSATVATTRATSSSTDAFLASTTSRRINPIPRRVDPTCRLGCYDRSSREKCHHTLSK